MMTLCNILAQNHMSTLCVVFCCFLSDLGLGRVNHTMSSPDGVDEISTIEDDVWKGASGQSGCDNPKPARAAFDAADDADVMNSPEEKAPKKNKNLGWYMWGFAGKMICTCTRCFVKFWFFKSGKLGKVVFFDTRGFHSFSKCVQILPQIFLFRYLWWLYRWNQIDYDRIW